MPPLPRLDSTTVTVQPAPSTSPVDQAAAVAVANAQAKDAVATQEIAGQVQQFAAGVMREESLKEAQIDAAKVVTYDAEGKPIVDESAKKWGGLVYNKAFDDAAVANFRVASVNDLNKRAETALIKHPTDPAGVEAELTPYIAGQLEAMPQAFRDQLAPQFSGVLNGAKSSATAGKARADIAEITRNVESTLQGLVIDAARVAGADMSPEAAQATAAATEGRTKDLMLLMKSAGWTQGTIDSTLEKVTKLIDAHKIGMREGAAVAADPSGAALGAATQRIEEYVTRPENSKHAQAMRDAIQPYLSRGGTVIAASERALAYNEGQRQAGVGMSVQAITQAVARGELSEGEGKEAARRLQQQVAVSQTSMRPTHALALGNTVAGLDGFFAGREGAQTQWQAQQDAKVLERYSAVAQTAMTMQTTGASPQERLEGFHQNQDIATDPTISAKAETDPSYARLRHNSRMAVGAWHAQASAVDRASFEQAITSGAVPTEMYPQVLAKGQELGYFGGAFGATPEQQTAMFTKGIEANRALARRDALANAGEAAVRAGSPMTKEQSEASVGRALGTKPGTAGTSTHTADGSGATNAVVAEITHAKADYALEWARGHHLQLPPGFPEALAAIGISATQEQQEAAVKLVRGHQAMWRQAMTKPGQSPWVAADLSAKHAESLFGRQTMEKVFEFEKGAGKATAEQIAKMLTMEPTGRNVSKDDKVDPLGVQSGLAQGLVDARDKTGIWGSISRTFNQMTGRDSALKQDDIRAVFGDAVPKGMTASNFRVGPIFAQEFTNWYATKYGPENAESLRQRGMSPADTAAFVYAMANKADIGINERKNPYTGEVTYELEKGDFYQRFKAVVPGAAGFSKDDIKNNVEGMVRFAAPHAYDKIQRGSLEIVGQMGPDGQMIYQVTGLSKTGAGVEQIAYVKPDDPIWNAGLKQLNLATAATMGKQSSESLWYAWVTAGLFRGDEKDRLNKELLSKMSGKGLPSEAWTTYAHGMRSILKGMLPGMSEEDWSKLAHKDVARLIEQNGWWGYVLGSTQEVPILPLEPERDKMLGTGGPLDQVRARKDALGEEQRIRTERTQQFLDARQKAMQVAPNGR